MNILITSAGRRVSLVQAFKEELKNLFPEGKVFAADARPNLSAACQVADSFFHLPRVDEPDYTEVLLSKCKSLEIKLVIPTIDTELEVLAKSKDLFAAAGTTLLVSDMKLVEKCRDKRLIHSFFTENGVNIAKEYNRDDYKLPLFLKPYDGSRSVDTFLIKDAKELTAYHLNHKKLMFLEYLDHNLYDEYTCDLYYARDHKLKCVVPRKRIEVRDGEVSKGVTKKDVLVNYIKKNLSFIDGAIGCLTVQFFKHKKDDLIYGIEINPRFGGGYPLSYIAGANFPKYIIEEYLLDKEVPEQFNSWKTDTLMLRYDHEIIVYGYKGDA